MSMDSPGLSIKQRTNSSAAPLAELLNIEKEYGFYWDEDSKVGDALQSIHISRNKFYTNDLLDIYEEHVINNQAIREFLLKALGKCCFVFNKLYGKKEGQISSILAHKANQLHATSEPTAIVVQLWKRDSEVVLYSGSHTGVFPNRSPAPNQFIQVPEGDVVEYQPVAIELQTGGHTVIDGFSCFQVGAGLGLFFGFVEESFKTKLKPMPIEARFSDRIERLKSCGIDMYVEIVSDSS